MNESKRTTTELLKDKDPYWQQKEVVPIAVHLLTADRAWLLWRYTMSTQYVYAICLIEMNTGKTLGDPAFFPAIDEAWTYWVKRCATS